jgi:hypothetical protein
MDDQKREYLFDNDSRMFVSGRGEGKSQIRGLSSFSAALSGFEDEVLRALDELDEHLVMEHVHEEEIGSYLEDNEDVAEKPGLLVAAGAVPLHEMSQVEFGNFRAYAMGDTIVVEEEAESGWQRATTVPYDVAVLVAQARAQHRAGSLQLEHDALREAASQEAQAKLQQMFGDDDDYFGTSPVQSVAQQQNTVVQATPPQHTQTVSADVTVSRSKMEEMAEELETRVKDATLERFSIGFGDSNER